jgi:hypothetical protein
MDKPTRNLIQNATQEARRLLEQEFHEQLQGTFDIMPDTGAIAPQPGAHLDARQRFIRSRIVAAIRHERAKSAGDAEAVQAYLREAAFTTLNRFAALKLMEARHIVQECVSRGEQSAGFREFAGLAPGLATLPDHGYRLYLECLFDEIGTELGVLFDRRDPASLLWPRRQALLSLLDILNRAELAAANIWAEDETIGWIYQYFNDELERRQMRDESAAPRNSRELAVRNQFFTPRYVVQFLSDNTLGRIWYEMTKGQTKLKDQCPYLVRRPHEYFLHDSTHNFENLRPDLFSQGLAGLPKDPTWEEIQAVAFTLYGAAEQLLRDLGLGEVPDYGLRKRREFESTGRYEGTFAELFGCLYFEQRDAKWSGQGDLHPERRVNRAKVIYQTMRAKLDQEASNLSPEDLLNQPVFIPHRPLKDPREIRMLDPACGSMHFGLYAFDLFEIIYEEAWDNHPELLKDLRAELSTLNSQPSTPEEARSAFLRLVPRLIIEHNIHGIDIDPRAVQIAGLSLWLRAQRAWQEQGVTPAERPPIRKSNVVCAEPMPGEHDLLRDFVEKEFPGAERPVFAHLLTQVFDKMKLAGEAGSLLKIEQEIRSAIAETRAQWQERRQEFFDPSELANLDQRRGTQRELASSNPQLSNLNLSGISDDQFWERVEREIYDALEKYAEHAGIGADLQRRLFAEDAARGFAFIDVCRKRYDVVAMNPPFGELADFAAPYLDARFPACKSDYYPCFIERGVDLLAPLGSIGAITNRTGFFLDGLSEWRRRFFEPAVHVDVFCDLGLGVLDALVETAAYVIRKHGPQAGPMDDACVCFPMLDVALEHRGFELLRSVESLCSRSCQVSVQFASTKSLLRIPNSPLAYRAPTFFVTAFTDLKPLESDSRKVRVTNPKGDDFRFVRTRWEVPPQMIGRAQRWVFLSKGGEYSNYYADIHLLIDWDERRKTYRGFVGTEHRPLTRPASLDHFFCKGLTFSRRTASRFSPRILPDGCIFTDQGPVIFSDTESDMLQMLAISNSRVFQGFLEMYLGSGDATSSGAAARHYEAGVIRNVPTPTISPENARILESDCVAMFAACREPDFREEISSLFVTPFGDALADSVRAIADKLHTDKCHRMGRMLRLAQQLESEVSAAYGLPAKAEGYLDALFGPQPLEYPKASPERKALIQRLVRNPVADVIQEAITAGITGRFITIKSYAADRQVEVVSHFTRANADDVILSVRENGPAPEDVLAIAQESFAYSLGCAFGRWDIRYATGEKATPESPDPFAPLPACPPGMLQNADGLPARPEDVPPTYPLRITWSGILVDDPNHPEDIERRVREAIEAIWPNRATPIENEACEILGAKSPRDYLQKSFFLDHLSRYSKSRRQAPIYWPLSTPSASYTIWLYYHRFTKDTFYRVQEIATEKFAYEERKLTALHQDFGPEPNAGQRKQLADQESFVQELGSFREEIARVAPLWNPNLNDGVIINFAPLWRLVAYRPWQKAIKTCWDSLVAAEYDWSHLALHLWPERVVPKCQTDRSLAIAHGLEELFWDEAEVGKPKPKKVTKPELQKLIAERTSPAAKEALQNLLTTPVAGGARKKGLKK